MNASVNDAVAYLQRTIVRVWGKGGRALPGYRRLAGEAGVAPATMLKALAFIAAQGVVSIDRKGITILSAPVHDYGPALLRKGRRWRQLLEQMRRDLAGEGNPPLAPLPSPKELRYRYGVSYRTLKKALDAMVDDGVIEPYLRTYRLTAAPRHYSSLTPTIVLLLLGESYGVATMVSVRTLRHLALLEEECRHRGVRLVVRTWYYEADVLRLSESLHAFEKEQKEAVLGYYIWSTAVVPHEVRAVVCSALAQGKPVAILDEEGNIDFSDLLQRPARLAHFRMAVGTGPGQDVARYLWNLGHRTFAFIDFEHCSAFGSNRYCGLKGELEQCGGAVVHSFEIARGKVYPLNPPSAHIIAHRLFGPSATPLHPTPGNRLSGDLVEQVVDSIHRIRCREFLFRRLGAVIDSGATAWIGCNDDIAIDCLDYLESTGVAVPAAISVMGFDDGFEALNRQMSSYNFNGAVSIRVALDFLLGGGSGGVTDAGGFVSVRRTTAQAGGGTALTAGV